MRSYIDIIDITENLAGINQKTGPNKSSKRWKRKCPWSHCSILMHCIILQLFRLVAYHGLYFGVAQVMGGCFSSGFFLLCRIHLGSSAFQRGDTWSSVGIAATAALISCRRVDWDAQGRLGSYLAVHSIVQLQYVQNGTTWEAHEPHFLVNEVCPMIGGWMSLLGTAVCACWQYSATALHSFAMFLFLIELDETYLFRETPPWSMTEESLPFGRAALSPCACAIGRKL